MIRMTSASNGSETRILKGKTNLAFRLCWHQPSTNQIYYRDNRQHANHTPATGSDISATEIIAHGPDILNAEGKIASRIRHILEDHPLVRQAWGDSKNPIFTVHMLEEADFGREKPVFAKDTMKRG